jgi:GTP-binding protein EngB required for normal cell division
MVKSKRIVRSQSHQNEDASKRKLEEILEPWFIDWFRKDYGIDGIVQTGSRIPRTKDVQVERNSFLIQLKATDQIKLSGNHINYSLPVRKVLQWVGSNIPVLFVLYDVGGDAFFRLWMDMDEFNRLEQIKSTWTEQQGVVVKIPQKNKLSSGDLGELERYVIEFRAPTKAWLQPGTFFELKNECQQCVADFSNVAKQFSFSSTFRQLEMMQEDIERSIYRIAVTGPSRVGKSSLINSILKKEICPVGFFQTTAVPIEILPGSKEEINIHFLDKTKVSHPFKRSVIASYASQDQNEDNEKKVAKVSLSVLSRKLQRGISVYDVPGLDDPDEEINEYTLDTVRKVNAIVYVIDASSARTGGFIFRREYKENILSFKQSLEKIFLVFNKCDELSEEILEKLKKRVSDDLQKHGIADKISEKVYYVSAKEDGVRPGNDSVAQLENDIWSYIINENRSGIARLATQNLAVQKMLMDFQDLLRARVANAEERAKIQEAISRVQKKIPELAQEIKRRIGALEKSIQASLISMKTQLLDAFELYLEGTPVDSFPTKEELQGFVRIELNKAIEAGNIEYGEGIGEIKMFTDQWIEENLKQIREILSSGTDQRVIDFKELAHFESPAADVSNSLGIGVFALWLGYLVAPEIAILAGISSFFVSFFMSREQKRAQRITKTVKICRNICDKSYEHLGVQYKEIAHEHIQLIGKYLDDKIRLYFNDLTSQMQSLPEISKEEQHLYQQSFLQITAINEQLNLFAKKISGY